MTSTFVGNADITALDPRFKRLVLLNVRLEKLHTGCRWAEGPAWFGAGRYLLWSDIPNDRVLRWDETDGSVSVFRSTAQNSNGHTVDPQGRLLSCEHLSRSVTRTEHSGKRTVLASTWKGQRFNSPNDVVVRSDGSVWFTDPTYGIDSDYEGERATSEIGASHVYRLDSASGHVTAVATDFSQPNGLAFSPDESLLYVSDTGRTHGPGGPRHIRRFKVEPDLSLSDAGILAICSAGLFDGFRVDQSGHIWASAGDGVHCFTQDGTLIGKILVPEPVANVCFGGAKLNRLFICATTSLYAIYLNTAGCSYGAEC